jgi:hypothetical protein
MEMDKIDMDDVYKRLDASVDLENIHFIENINIGDLLPYKVKNYSDFDTTLLGVIRYASTIPNLINEVEKNSIEIRNLIEGGISNKHLKIKMRRTLLPDDLNYRINNSSLGYVMMPKETFSNVLSRLAEFDPDDNLNRFYHGFQRKIAGSRRLNSHYEEVDKLGLDAFLRQNQDAFYLFNTSELTSPVEIIEFPIEKTSYIDIPTKTHKFI